MSQRFKATLNRLIENTAKTNPGRRSRRNPPIPSVRGIQFDSMTEARMYISGEFDENTSFAQSAEFQGIAFGKPSDLRKWQEGTIQGELAGSAIFANEMFLTFDELRAAHESYAAPPAASAAPTAAPQSPVGGFSAPTRPATMYAPTSAPVEMPSGRIPGQFEQTQSIPWSPRMGRTAGPRTLSPEEIEGRTSAEDFISDGQAVLIRTLITEEVLNQCTVIVDGQKKRPLGDRTVGASSDAEGLKRILKRYGINKQSATRWVNLCKQPTFPIPAGHRYGFARGGQLAIAGIGPAEVPLIGIDPNKVRLAPGQKLLKDAQGNLVIPPGIKTESALMPYSFEYEDDQWASRYHALELLKQAGFTGCKEGFAADPRELQQRRRRSGGDFATNNPSYMIPLQFPTERYIYAPDANYAHWTSSPVWSQAEFVRNNPRKMPVPDYIEKTKRSAATKISAIGKKGHWPIGDLYHARLAMIYIMSPSHQKVREKVIRAVKKHYPSYDWDGFLEEREMQREDYQAAANPNDRMFTISRGNPKKYVATRMNPQGTPIPMPTNAGPYLPDMFPYGVGGRPAALQNPKRKK